MAAISIRLADETKQRFDGLDGGFPPSPFCFPATCLLYLVAFYNGIKVVAIVFVGIIKNCKGHDGVATSLVFSDKLKILRNSLFLGQVAANSDFQLILALLDFAITPVCVGSSCSQGQVSAQSIKNSLTSCCSHLFCWLEFAEHNHGHVPKEIHIFGCLGPLAVQLDFLAS